MAQNKFIDRIEAYFADVADWSLKNRGLVIAGAILMLLAGGYQATKVRFDGSLEGFFEKSDPVYASYLEYLDEFNSDELTYILYRAPDKEHGPFDIEVMRAIDNLTQALELEVPFVREVTSLTNVEFMFAEEDTLIVDELMINFPENQQAMLAVKKQLMSKPLYVDYLINSTGDYAAIFLEMSAASPDPLEKIIDDPAKGDHIDNLYPQASDLKVREILARPELADSGIEFYLTGDVPMNSTYNHLYMDDSAFISLITLVLIALISFILLRTKLAGLLAPLSVVVLSVVMMLGMIGALGWTVGLFISMAPSLICAIGVAQAVHILQEYNRSMAIQGNKSVAVKESITKVGGPCLLAALTTAAGFSVMLTSELEGLGQFGAYSAIGVVFTFILSITLLLVFLAGKKGDLNQSTSSQQNEHGSLDGVNPAVGRVVSAVIQFNHQYPRAIVIGFGLVFLWAFVGLTKLSVDFNFLDEFKDSVQWKRDTLLADEVMGGIMGVSYILETSETNGVKNVDFLKALDRVQQHADSLPLVKKSVSIVDFVKDLNRTFHNDDPSYYRIPDSQELVSQLLLVYEVSGGDELYEQVDQDFTRTVLDMRVVMSDMSEIRGIIEEVDAFVAANPVPGAHLRPTGIGLLWVRIADYISNTQITAYSLIFVIILVVMTLAYGSLKVGLLCMIPNLTPIVITLGAMGWFGISLDYMKLLLATIAIGIAVDDTIHLTTRFRSRFYQLGNYADAMTASLRDVGPALIITTTILMGAFCAYQFTELAVLSMFGILLGATIGLALLADLLLMPVIFALVKPFGAEFKPS